VIRRIAIYAVVVAGCSAAIFATAATGGDDGKSYKVVFDNAFGLTEGGDLRMAGVRAGETTTFELTDTEPVRSIVGFKITEPGFDSLRSDATCAIRQQSLIGEYYVDCQPGSSDKELPAGATIPVEQTESIIPLDLVQDVLRRPYRERLGLIIAELGTGLAGRPDDLAAALARAHPGLRETSKTLRILGDQRQTIEDFVANSDTVVAELAKNKVDVTRFVREAARTSDISASRSADLQSGFQKLPGFLAELRPYMSSLGDVADKNIALLPDLRRASGDLNRFFDRLGPFAEETKPALHALAGAADEGQDALRSSRPAVHELAEASKDAPKLATPLRQFLVSLDDRGRATQQDVRAKRSAPPSPDPTHKNAERGFTGFEAFLDYAYWQTLAINGFLRIYGVVDDCTFYIADPTRSQVERCNAYMGPFQPGIKNATGEINGHDFGKADSGDYSDYGGKKENKANGGSKSASKASAELSGFDPRFSEAAGQGAAEAVNPSGQGEQPGFGGGTADEGDRNPLSGVGDLVNGLTDRILRRDEQDEPDSQPAPDSQDGSGKLLDFLLGP
jgi:virulence factor Mce-like protein